MKKFLSALILSGMTLVTAATGYGGNFAPEPLIISAPGQINIQFGYPLEFPFTLSGGPASAGLAIFTRDRAPVVRDVRNGYLGWHYMNHVDTCMYLSPTRLCQPGANTITWDGLDNSGYRAMIYQHRYFLWACDTESAPIKALEAFRGYGFGRSALVVRDEQGVPLANPVLYSAAQALDFSGETWNTRARWVIGGDPQDTSIAETTRYRSHPDRGRMAVSPLDHRLFFTQAIESGKMTTREWEWISNGDAVLQSEWGVDYMIDVDSALDPDVAAYSGPLVLNGDFLISTDLARRDSRTFPALDYFDVRDGTHIVRFDLSPWFDEYSVPTELAQRNSRLLLSSPGSALFQVVNPFADDEDMFVLWENGIGDGFGDLLPAPGEPRGTAMDRNGFALFLENGPSPSIGMFAPDGAGAGIFPLPGMTGSQLDGMQIIDSGSVFDGIYFGTSDSGGDVWHVRFAMCEGMVTDPAEWFHSHIFIYLPWEGDTVRAGKTFTVKWHGADFVTLRIEFSGDDGLSWTMVADNVAETGFWGEYRWTVPDIRSTACRLRLTSTVKSYLESTSGSFAIDGPVGVADDISCTVWLGPNTPNPFNPATTISFILPEPGTAALSVYDITGRKVTELARGFHASGRYTVTWNAAGCASGVYFCVLRAGTAVETRKMLLMR